MDMFKMFKEASSIKNKLSQMDKSLREKIIEVEKNGVKVKINAKSEVLELKLTPELLKQEAEKVEKTILSVIQEAIKKSQDIMAQEARKITGGLNIPGLTGLT